MAITEDWDVDFVNKLISHVDGDLDYDSNTGTRPSVGDYIRGNTSGAIGKILSRSGTTAAGTFTLTNVQDRFQNNESLVAQGTVAFDNVQSSGGGFSVGDTLTGTSSSATVTIRAIEYNYQESDVAGSGRVYGPVSGTFSDNEQLWDGTNYVALANGASSSGATFTGALVNEASGTITPPSQSTNTSVIINFDGGTKDYVRFSKVTDGSGTKSGVIQQVYGVTATGSLKLIDVSGSWSDNDAIHVTNKLNYNNQQTTFKTGDKIVGTRSNASGKVIAIVDDGDNTGKLTLQNQTGTFQSGEVIVVRTASDTYAANVENTNFTEDHGGDVVGSPITEQLATQGGLYASTDSLNIVRDSNALYTFLQDTFDELGALDDEVPMSAQVALQQFTLINNWKIPDLSFRFLESGSIQDESLDNIWTNYQTLGTVEGIGNTAYAATTPLPQFYIEQNGSVISPWWYYGHIDVLVKVKTNTDTSLTTTGTGVLINSGTVTIFNRNFGDTYDHFETTTIAGVAPIPLATSNDLDNQTGTHEMDYDLLSGTFSSGEEFVEDTDVTKRGIITKINTSPDNLEFIQTGASTFAKGDTFTGQSSSATGRATEAQQNLVASYGTRIVAATVDGNISTGPNRSGTFDLGELVTQDSSGAQAIVMYDNTSNQMVLGNITGTFDGSNVIRGQNSGAAATASSTLSVAASILRDIGDGNGNQPYNAVIYLNRDDDDTAGGMTLARMYEWVKYRTRSLETTGEPAYQLLGGPGNDNSAVQGRLYISLYPATYALKKASPLGTFAGGKFFGARGVFIQDMASSDIRNYQLIDANGVVRDPPNLQTLTVTSVVSGDRVAVFRTSGGNIQTDEYQIGTVGSSYNQSGDTKILIQDGTRDAESAITDLPDASVIRVLDPNDSGLYLSISYSAITRTGNAKFTLDTSVNATIGSVTSSTDLVQGDNCYVPLIEEQATSTSVSKNIVYVSDIPILTRVRIKGILPFEVAGTFGSGGASVAAIRTFDSIVD